MLHALLVLIGLAGTLAFAWGCVPTAWATWKAGKSVGTPVGLAWNILIACLLFYFYTLATYGFNLLIGSCGLIEMLAYGVVIWYHYFPRPEAPGQGWSEFDKEVEEHRAEIRERERVRIAAEKTLDPNPLRDMSFTDSNLGGGPGT